jgi:hypothetical protein
MKFERGKDIKESLNLGLEAIPIKSVHKLKSINIIGVGKNGISGN